MSVDEFNTKYEIDLIHTILANLINLVFMLFLLVFFAMFLTQISYLDNDVNRLLGLFVFLFVAMRLIQWLIIPQFCYREKKGSGTITLKYGRRQGK